tara:strand:+ start:476 stop:610 length:135 start_codon:yes stop_codon:yes gene_type:complete
MKIKNGRTGKVDKWAQKKIKKTKHNKFEKKKQNSEKQIQSILIF